MLKDGSDSNRKKVEEKTTIHKNQEVEFYTWVNENGNKLSCDEIIEQFKIRSEKAYRLSKIRFNMSRESLNKRSFKFYNDYCFYERRTSYGSNSSYAFNGKIDNKNYENGKLVD